jgi:flagellar biosynthetic protein FliR
MPSTLQLLTLFLIFVRILAVMVSAPILSSQDVPVLVKIGLAGLLAVLVLPIETARSTPPSWPTSALPFMLVVGQEVLIGVLIGFVSNLVFVVVALAANMLAFQTGLQAAQILDPLSNISSTVLEQFYSMIAILLFLVINGHHWLLIGLARTFEVAPAGTFVLSGLTLDRLMVLTTETISTGIRIALPIAGSLLLTDLALGLMARAVPQVQVFFLGLPLKIALGFVLIAFTLSMMLPVVKDLMGSTVNNMLAVSTTQ